MKPGLRTELEHLLSAVCDEQATAEQRLRLDELLRDHAECRKFYLHMKDGETEGVWAFGGKTGTLEGKSTSHYKDVALLYASQLDKLKAWFEEVEETERQKK